jgi:hypothetical protein
VELDVLPRRSSPSPRRAIRDLADRRSCSASTIPPGIFTRSMNVPIFGLSW